MKASLPAQTKHTTPWEGGEISPLRLPGEKTAEPSGQATAAPVVKDFPAKVDSQPWLLRHVVILLCVAAFSFAAYYAASRYVVTAVVIQGRSMTPTLNDGDRYYLNRWRYMFTAPERGDLVVIKDPGHSDYAVKRIVAKPNDWLNIREGKVYLNGKRLAESYLAEGTRTEFPDLKEKWIQLGHDQYYVLGDNRKASEDSRFYGVVHRGQILGILVK